MCMQFHILKAMMAFALAVAHSAAPLLALLPRAVNWMTEALFLENVNTKKLLYPPPSIISISMNMAGLYNMLWAVTL